MLKGSGSDACANTMNDMLGCSESIANIPFPVVSSLHHSEYDENSQKLKYRSDLYIAYDDVGVHK